MMRRPRARRAGTRAIAGFVAVLAMVAAAQAAAAQEIGQQYDTEAEPGNTSRERMTDPHEPGFAEDEANPDELDQPEEARGGQERGEHFDQPPAAVPLATIVLVGVLAAIVVLVILRRGRDT